MAGEGEFGCRACRSPPIQLVQVLRDRVAASFNNPDTYQESLGLVLKALRDTRLPGILDLNTPANDRAPDPGPYMGLAYLEYTEARGVERCLANTVTNGGRTMQKKALIVRATTDNGLCELDGISAALNDVRIQADKVDLTASASDPVSDLVDYLKTFGDDYRWDYVYVCAHGTAESFGTGAWEQSDITIPWWKLSSEICDRLNEGAIVLAACCRGGLKSVAHTIFSYCGNVDAVTGPRFAANASDLRVGFTAFLHHIECRHNDPTEAASAASAAAGIEFRFYDRLEEQAPGFFPFARWEEAEGEDITDELGELVPTAT